jgi:nitrogen-specific signal transduction histidine kinase/ActR/RegA family two-component response regulator
MIRDNTVKKRIEEEVFKKEKIASVGILAAGIAHDFNNLLTAILGNISLSKLLAIKENNAKVIQSLETAEKAAIRAKDLSFQLLTFSKGGDPIKKQTSLQGIIQESANFILRGSKNKLETIIPDDIWTVEADPGQIGQVIQNLVLNADQATVKPGTITISCSNVTIDEHNHGNLNIQNGKYVRVAVKDEGTGIPEELKNKIFDPYFSTKSIGNGLGLTTCYNIIEKHQGDLKFSSVLNKGTEFYFYLPVDKHINLTKENKASDDEKVAIGSGKIMVVDDEEMVRDLVFDILTGLGYNVECFPEGGSAISKYKEVFETDPFDIVITDLTIPGGIGGKEVVSSILKINPKAKIIVSSGYSNDPMMAEHIKYGFSGVIPKPYDVEALSKVITNAMQHKN